MISIEYAIPTHLTSTIVSTSFIRLLYLDRLMHSAALSVPPTPSAPSSPHIKFPPTPLPQSSIVQHRARSIPIGLPFYIRAHRLKLSQLALPHSSSSSHLAENIDVLCVSSIEVSSLEAESDCVEEGPLCFHEIYTSVATPTWNNTSLKNFMHCESWV